MDTEDTDDDGEQERHDEQLLAPPFRTRRRDSGDSRRLWTPVIGPLGAVPVTGCGQRIPGRHTSRDWLSSGFLAQQLDANVSLFERSLPY